MADKQRDGWEKAAMILQSIGGFVTASVVALLGIVGSTYLNEKQKTIETNVRLYSELMSKREEAESALRKDMFKTIIDTFVKPQAPSIDVRVLNLELLAYNFHESLNLKPLFINIDLGRSVNPPMLGSLNIGERLNRVAREITRKQMVVLEGAGINSIASSSSPSADLYKRISGGTRRSRTIARRHRCVSFAST